MVTKQISRINVYQSSKFCAMVHFVVFAFFFLIFGLVALLAGAYPPGEILLAGIAMAIFVPLWTFVVYAVVFWFYNWIASMVGGIEVEVKDIK